MTKKILSVLAVLLLLSSCLGKGEQAQPETVDNDVQISETETLPEDSEGIDGDDTNSELEEEPEIESVSAPEKEQTEDTGGLTLLTAPGGDTSFSADPAELIPIALTTDKDGMRWIRMTDLMGRLGWIAADPDFWNIEGLPVMLQVDTDGIHDTVPAAYFGSEPGYDSIVALHQQAMNFYSRDINELQSIPGLMNYTREQEYSIHDIEKTSPYFAVGMFWDNLELHGFLWEDGNSGKTADQLYIQSIHKTLVTEEERFLGISRQTSLEDLVELFGQPNKNEGNLTLTWFVEMSAVTFYLNGNGTVENILVENFWD